MRCYSRLEAFLVVGFYGDHITLSAFMRAFKCGVTIVSSLAEAENMYTACSCMH